MKELVLKSNPTIQDFQKYVAQLVVDRGFEKETLSEVFMLFLEECGELAKAARKSQNIKSDEKSEKFLIENELSDVFTYLLIIANYFNADLEQSFRDKEVINKKRVWN